MIAGELEAWLDSYGPDIAEDSFFGKPKNPNREPGKGKEIINKIGGVVNSLGGFASIGRTIDNLGGRSNPYANLSEQDTVNQQPPPPPPKKKVPVVVWVIGGVVLLAGATLLILSLNKKPTA